MKRLKKLIKEEIIKLQEVKGMLELYGYTMVQQNVCQMQSLRSGHD